MNDKGLRKQISKAAAVLSLALLPATNVLAEGGESTGDGFASLIPLVLIMVIFWVLLIRPQQKRMKAHGELIKGLKKGDKVVTAGGVFGQITDVKEKYVVVEVAEGVRLKVKQDTILNVQEND